MRQSIRVRRAPKQVPLFPALDYVVLESYTFQEKVKALHSGTTGEAALADMLEQAYQAGCDEADSQKENSYSEAMSEIRAALHCIILQMPDTGRGSSRAILNRVEDIAKVVGRMEIEPDSTFGLITDELKLYIDRKL